MPVTELICPNCGNQMRANALSKAGVTGSPCRECKERILVETDDDGDIINIALDDGFDDELGDEFSGGLADDEDDGAEEESEYGAVRSRGVAGYFDTGLLKSVLLPAMLLVALVGVAWIASSVYTTRPQLAIVRTPTDLPATTPETRPEQSVEPTATPRVAAASVETPARRPVSPREIALSGLDGVRFAQNQAVLPPESLPAFAEVLTRIKAAPPGSLFEIGGHTDNEGSEAYNRQLSLRRAEAVKEYLVKQGVPAARLQVKGYGAARPVVSNESDLGKEQNRRIAFTQLK